MHAACENRKCCITHGIKDIWYFGALLQSNISSMSQVPIWSSGDDGGLKDSKAVAKMSFENKRKIWRDSNVAQQSPFGQPDGNLHDTMRPKFRTPSTGEPYQFLVVGGRYGTKQAPS